MLSEHHPDSITQTEPPITLEHNSKRKNKHIVTLDDSAIEIDLISEYSSFKKNKSRTTLCHRANTLFNTLCDRCLLIMKVLWLEVIPKHFCGPSQRLNHIQKGDHKQKLLFEEFRKKKTRFFLIVLGADCSEEQIQQAYENASFVTGQGLSKSLDELRSKTSCNEWSVPSVLTCKKYLIIFMKFDCFDHLLRFGQLSQQYILSMQNRQKEMSMFKQELQECYRRYEQMERSFVGSYVQKEDKILFE